MFILILTIGIITAFAQIMASFNELKKPEKKGIGGITVAGWVFYTCKIVLAVLPAIQKVWQDSIDDDKTHQAAIDQDNRDNSLRKNYDSSLIVMKEKFDTTTSIVSQTLGKYGFKLDSTNQVLINIRDSANRKVFMSDDPVITIATEPTGIVYNRKSSDSTDVFNVFIQSMDAGSSYFNIKSSMVICDSMAYFYPRSGIVDILEYNRRIAKDAIIQLWMTVPIIRKPYWLFIWLRGTYKRLDGTGIFNIDELYRYNYYSKTVVFLQGKTKENIIRIFRSFEN
jgi:hypothetical protein